MVRPFRNLLGGVADVPVHTGEEEEETVYQTRSKLYVMQGDGGWRERGVGTLKLNVRASDGKGARLGKSLQHGRIEATRADEQ